MSQEIQGDDLSQKLREENTIIAQLEKANAHLAQQNSLRRVFAVGIIHGIGFFIGSAIIATIALGIFGPLLSNVPWVRQPYEAGTKLTPR
mgnify:CR=1 FL=1